MMNCITVACSEFVNLNYLAVYSVVTNAIDASFGITTLIMLGHLGKGHLSAGVIALAFYNISWYFMEGLLTAQDSLVARAFALNDRESARYWSYISVSVAILLCIPATVLFIMAAIIIQYAFLIRPHTAAKAASFLILLLPGLWAHSVYRVAQKYLQCQQKMTTPIVCGVVGIGANLLGSYLLSFVFEWGFSGCAIASTIARAIMLIAIVSSICKTEDIRRAVDEVTVLVRSLRNQYNNLDEIADPSGQQTRQKASSSVTDKAGKEKSKKDRKVHIAPTGSEAESEVKADAAERGVEMVALESTQGDGDTDRLIANNDNASAVSSLKTSSTADADTVDNADNADTEISPADDTADDTQSLLRPTSTTSTTNGAIDITGMVTAAPKRVIIADMLRFLFLGIPGGLVLGMEFWVFEIVTVIIAHMGSVVVATNQILLTITSFFFLSLPFALSIAATVQISRQLAKKRYKKARTTAYLCVLEGSALMALAALLMWALRDYSGYLFTNNQDIVHRLRALAPYNAGFQVAYGIYGSAQGVLRATSHQLDLLGWTFIAVWLVGLPVGLYLCFVTRPTYGLEGLWIGLIVGMGLLAFAVLLQVYLLDWEKEARKAEYRLRRGGVAAAVGSNIGAVGGERSGVKSSSRSRKKGSKKNRHAMANLDYDDEEDGNEFVDLEIAIPGMRRLSQSMNPLRSNVYSNIPLPSIGSRAAGGLPLDELFGNADEDLDELEYIEFGDKDGSASEHSEHSDSNSHHSAGHQGTTTQGRRARAEEEEKTSGDVEMAQISHGKKRMPLPDDEEDLKRYT